jgi:hypothetical protein
VASIIERIDLGYTSNPVRVLIGLTVMGAALTIVAFILPQRAII